MTLPELPTTGAKVSETTDSIRQNENPGDAEVRSFQITHGPRDSYSELISSWVDELLEAEFSDVTVEKIWKDRTYVGKNHADWSIEVVYELPERSTFQVPVSVSTATVSIDACSADEAVSRAQEEFEGETVTGHGTRAEINITVADISDSEAVTECNSSDAEETQQ